MPNASHSGCVEFVLCASRLVVLFHSVDERAALALSLCVKTSLCDLGQFTIASRRHSANTAFEW